jgi:hypothetical protein
MEVASDVATEKADPRSITPLAIEEEGGVSDTMKGAEYRKLIWKLDVRLLPPLFVLWFISLVDRVNIGTARIQDLEKDLGMDPRSNQFNFAASKTPSETGTPTVTIVTYHYLQLSSLLV